VRAQQPHPWPTASTATAASTTPQAPDARQLGPVVDLAVALAGGLAAATVGEDATLLELALDWEGGPSLVLAPAGTLVTAAERLEATAVQLSLFRSSASAMRKDTVVMFIADMSLAMRVAVVLSSSGLGTKDMLILYRTFTAPKFPVRSIGKRLCITWTLCLATPAMLAMVSAAAEFAAALLTKSVGPVTFTTRLPVTQICGAPGRWTFGMLGLKALTTTLAAPAPAALAPAALALPAVLALPAMLTLPAAPTFVAAVAFPTATVLAARPGVELATGGPVVVAASVAVPLPVVVGQTGWEWLMQSEVSLPRPSHGFPPCSSLCLARTRALVPLPQLTEHICQSLHCCHWQSMAHGCVLQGSCAFASSEHGGPPYCASFTLSRVRVRTPPPQVWLQSVQLLQEPHSQATGQGFVLQGCVSRGLSRHVLPPWFDCVRTLRSRKEVPLPQVCEQVDQRPQSDQTQSTGQSLVLQLSLASGAPSQGLPP